VSIYDYSECDEIADNMANAFPGTRMIAHRTFDEWLVEVIKLMPGEDPAGTIVNNVAWSLYCKTERPPGDP